MISPLSCYGSVMWQNVSAARMHGKAKIAHDRKQRGMPTDGERGRDITFNSRVIANDLFAPTTLYLLLPRAPNNAIKSSKRSAHC